LHDYDSQNWPHVHSVANRLLAQYRVVDHTETLKSFCKTTHTPFETVVPVAPIDISKFPYLISSLVSYTDTLAIHVITPDPKQIDIPKPIRVPVFVHADDTILKIDRSRLKHRPNWVAQQFLKLFQNVTMTNWYLVIDADLFFNRPVNFFINDEPVMMFGIDQYHEPYFEFNQRMIGIDRVFPHSFLSECTLYSKYLIEDMLSTSGYESHDEFIEKAIEIIDGSCYPAESELYGNYVTKAHPGAYLHRKLKASLGGKYCNQEWSKDEIEAQILKIKPQDVDIFTMHSWEGSV
jgi:hypothetical protein